jgi:hypothetical protein
MQVSILEFFLEENCFFWPVTLIRAHFIERERSNVTKLGPNANGAQRRDVSAMVMMLLLLVLYRGIFFFGRRSLV